MVQSATPLLQVSKCTNFGGREGQNISRGFVFAGAPKNNVSHVLIITKSPKMRKIAKFNTRENLVPLIRLLYSMDR